MKPNSRDGSHRPQPSARHPVRVVLTDRDRTVRDAIADLLELDPTVSVVGEADSVDRALALLPGLQPDVVILDPRLPDGDGLSICRKHRDTSRFLILTADGDPDRMLAAVDAGAAGYMIKDLTELALADAVRVIAVGGSRLDCNSAPVLMRELRNREGRARDPIASLTTMEMTIMLLLAEGLTDQQVADRLFFSENTIRDYVTRLTRKLGLSDRSQAALHAGHLRASSTPAR
ncbi:response regulator [Nocardia seriolae]|uniref:Protein-glutamate methylesterase n=1 Tax=Nocardia seriolae TaxID=37332 RepID=A0A0B8NAQ6_9NOCA|nr:response regulator transcription factor [Nocardia seriolae]APB00115.1 Protein-glutamate methylesterase [Nocardia seriolae]MTJ64791.1 response regulator [Nocardia seriolae]MTJ72586.1 response regulator [Nocardia seriolae]MTJ89627.1 response regulator [Nocardia seriolae]MTK33602.1 response regulator [Nocardia seriolae]